MSAGTFPGDRFPDKSPSRTTFRVWRQTRPFWGGLTAIVAGIWLYGITAAPFSLMVIQGIAGISSLLIGIMIILLAVITWFQPQLRTITGLTIVVLALASILLSNLGGFLVGMLLGVHSGASIAAWKPRPDPQPGSGTLPSTDAQQPAPQVPGAEGYPYDPAYPDQDRMDPHGSAFSPGQGFSHHQAYPQQSAAPAALPDPGYADPDDEDFRGYLQTGPAAYPRSADAGRASDPTEHLPVPGAPLSAEAPDTFGVPTDAPVGPVPTGGDSAARSPFGATRTGPDAGPGPEDAPGTPAAGTDAVAGEGSPEGPSLRRPRGGRVQGIGVVLAVVSLSFAPAPRAAAATGAPAAAPRSSVFCTLFPWLCPAPSPTPTPTPSGTTPTPTPSTTSGPPSGGGTGGTGGTGTGTGTPSGGGTTPIAPILPGIACDLAQLPFRSMPGGRAARTAAAILQACSTQKSTTAAGTKPAASGGFLVSAVPAHLVANKESMDNLVYEGVVTVQTANGPQKALKFHADKVTIEGMQQDVAHPSANMALTAGGNVVLQGNVQLYVLRQKGKAYGLLPLTISPSFMLPLPPGLPIFFTDVDADIAYLEADTLTVPTGRITVT